MKPFSARKVRIWDRGIAVRMEVLLMDLVEVYRRMISAFMDGE
jgi:hypothetical protein